MILVQKFQEKQFREIMTYSELYVTKIKYGFEKSKN